jgi:hypothetical protein
LAIYLQDHLAGATVGLELVRRARGANAGTELGDWLGSLAAEIEEDRDSLRGIMRRLGVGDDRVKIAAAWAGEKAGRLKLNGRLLGYSPLSRVVELEGLIVGVNGKLAGWRVLRDLAGRERSIDAAELDRLIDRGERQLEGLEQRHRRAAADALAQR